MDSMIIRGKKYNYVWGDEFNEDTIDYVPLEQQIQAPKKWKPTRMIQYYPDYDIPTRPEDMKRFNYIENGELVLKAGCFDWSKNYKVGDKGLTRHTITEAHKYADGGVLATRDTMVFRRGYAEIRAKMPFKNGAWSAWWTRSANSPIIKYPEFGGTDWKDPIYNLEIDIIEIWASQVAKVYPNIHKWYSNTFVSDGTTDGKGIGKVYDYDGNDVTDQITEKQFYEYKQGKAHQFTSNIGGIYEKDARATYREVENPDEYHTYGFLWTEEEMTMSIDGVEYFTMDITKDFDGYNDGKYGFNQYMYFLFDCHMRTPGSGKRIDRCFGGTGDTNDIEMRIEYIRLYQEEGKEDIIIK